MSFQPDDFNFGGPYTLPDVGNPGSGPNPGPARNESISGKMQAQMWQEQHYMGGPESGFISASTTQPSSRTGHEDNIEDGCFTGPGSIAGGSLYDMDSAAPSEVNSIASSHPGLSDPVEHIPQLVTSLSDEDVVVVQESLHLVDRSVRKEHFNENFFNALIRSSALVCAIVNAMTMAFQTMITTNNVIKGHNNNNNNNENSNSIEEAKEAFEAAEKRARTASDILRAMTNRQESSKEDMTSRTNKAENQRIACRNILFSGGVAALTSLMACNVDRIKFNGAITIHSVLLSLRDDEKEKAKLQVREANGVRVMVSLLERDNVKLLTILCDCLYILATGDPPTKALILECNGTKAVISTLDKATYNKLIERAVKLLQALSVCPNNKQVIIRAGGMEVLARHLVSADKIPSYCSLTMRNLSDTSTHIANPDRLAEQLVASLRHRDMQVALCAAGIISNLTVNNEALKLGVCKARGIQELVRAVDNLGANKDLLDPAMCALRHLTNNHANVEQAQKLFVHELDGLARLARWLHPDTVRPCLKAVLGVVRNLAQKPFNHAILRERQFVHQVLQILVLGFNEMNQKGPAANKPVDGVKMMEIIEVCINCVYGFSRSVENRAVLRDPAIVSILKTVLTNPSANVQRLTCGILAELAQEREGAFVIYQTGPCSSIESLIGKYNKAPDNSPQQKIASFACSTMNEIERMKKALDSGEFRPPNVQQQFNIGPFSQPHIGQGQPMPPLPPQPQHQQQPPQAFNPRQPQQPPPHHFQSGQAHLPMGGEGFANNQFQPNFQPHQHGMGPNAGFEDLMSEQLMHNQPMGGPPGVQGFDSGPPMGTAGFIPDDMDMFGPDDPGPNFAPPNYFGDGNIQ